MTPNQLKDILTKHKKWLESNGADGERADLCDADLSDADLGRANLSDANLCGATLWRANLCGANLGGANLGGADLCGANLGGAKMSGAKMSGANLWRANLCGANLGGANLGAANLGGAILGGANLCGAKGIIRVGPSSDGYEFFGVVRGGKTWISAGCRWFTVADARKHWKKTRGGTDLGKERLRFVDLIAAWGHMEGSKEMIRYVILMAFFGIAGIYAMFDGQPIVSFLCVMLAVICGARLVCSDNTIIQGQSVGAWVFQCAAVAVVSVAAIFMISIACLLMGM